MLLSERYWINLIVRLVGLERAHTSTLLNLQDVPNCAPGGARTRRRASGRGAGAWQTKGAFRKRPEDPLRSAVLSLYKLPSIMRLVAVWRAPGYEQLNLVGVLNFAFGGSTVRRRH